MFNETSMTRALTKKFCNANGGYLVEIGSQAENDAIVEEIDREGYKERNVFFWIGLKNAWTDTAHTKRAWILDYTKQSPAYTNWGQDQPGTFDYAYINEQGSWSGTKATASALLRSALCEKI
jgi:hypothetical protein